MLLIDEIVSQNEGRIVTRSHITADNVFYVPGRGIPSYVGFEMMAQSISAQDGCLRRESGEAPAIGLLLGCRKYSTSRDWFADGETLETEAVPLLNEGEMRSFECRVRTLAGQELAHGVINVFRPSDPDAFLAQMKADHAR